MSYVAATDCTKSQTHGGQSAYLFYQGRTKLPSQGIKLEKLGVEGDYLPEEDTCIAAFVRLLAAAARSSDEASAA